MSECVCKMGGGEEGVGQGKVSVRGCVRGQGECERICERAR